MTRIISIDDSKAIHAFLKAIFEPIHCDLLHAFDGPQGLQMLVAPETPPIDLILLDWEMPKLTGIETLQKIRSAGVKTPVVMLTSKNNPDEIAKALECGANEYVMKPFTKEILIDKIETVLERKLV